MFLLENGNLQGKKTALMEANEKNFIDFNIKKTEAAVKRYAESVGIKDYKNILDLSNYNFSAKDFRRACYEVARRLKEAQPENMFGQLLRAGVQNTFNNIYQAVPVTYTSVVKESGSNKRQEFYAPLERVGFPKEIENGDHFPESNFKGLDLELINKKKGMMLAFERELFDDDQTGQIQDRVSQMAENTRIYENAFVWTKICNSATSLDGQALGVSQTYSTVYSTSGIHTGGFGINALSNGRLSQSKIEAGYILSVGMKDQSGRPMLVQPKVLAVSKQDMFYADILLNSTTQPSMASTAAADIGKVGGVMSKNPIQNLVGIVVDRFIIDYAAILIDSGKGFVFQRRDPTEVVQENPMSGPAFSQEIFRYRNRSRWQADFIDPKFFINLNPGFSSS